MASSVTLSVARGTRTDVGGNTVSVKQIWSDAWTPVTGLHADEIVDAAAPSFPTARLYWRFGRGKLPTDPALTTKSKLSYARWYVKIDVGNLPSWYGTIEIDNEKIDGPDFGVGQSVDMGKQTMICYGLTRQLDLQPILSSRFYDSGNAQERTAGFGMTFNEDGQPNRTNGRFAGSFLFSDDPGDANNGLWTSHDIVEYLVKHHAPSSGSDLREFLGLDIRWRLVDQNNILPNWDRPIIKMHGHTVWKLLNSMMPRHRLLSFKLQIANNGEVQIIPFSFAEEVIDLGDNAKIEPNASQKTVDFDTDPSADAVLVNEHADVVDEVIVTGARRTSTVTLQYNANEIAKGWTSDEETDYEDAASNAGDYPGSGEPGGREKRNREYRNQDSLKHVFSRFVLHDTFLKNQTATPDSSARVVFPDVDDESQAHICPRGQVKILDHLILLERHDYSDSAIGDENITKEGEPPYRQLGPLVIAKLPEYSSPDRYQEIDRLGQLADLEHDKSDTNREFSCSIDVESRQQAIRINVSGTGYQHVIAATDFQGLSSAAAHGERPAILDYVDWFWTLTLEEDRLVEGKKKSDALGLGNDIPRRLYIDAGDDYRLDYVVPDTVVGLDEELALVRSDGGYVTDSRKQLLKIATVAHKWYSVERRALTLSTGDDSSGLGVGDFITTIGSGATQRTVNAVITSLTITCPRAQGGGTPGPVKLEYKTQFGELDPLKAFPA